MQFNAQKAYVKQMDKGEDYDLLQPVYTLVLLNENYDEKTNNFYHHFQTINKENTEEVIEGLEYVLVELQKFSSQTWSDRKLAVLWLRFLSEVNENLTDLPEEFTENKDILQAAVICEKAAFSEAELAAYEKYWDTIRLEKTLTSGFYKDGIKAGEKIGIKKGEKIGIEKGKVEGRDERNLEIAKELKKDNMPIELIVKYTGLSAEEINKLK
jgi:predicted transposase/invertase (TIGR01784 family)